MMREPTDDPLEEDDMPSSFEPETVRTVARIKSVNPANAEQLERHLGDLVVSDIAVFVTELSLLPREHGRAAAYLAVEELRRIMLEIGHACRYFDAVVRSET